MNTLSLGRALSVIRPNSEYVMRGNEIEWLDDNEQKPTKAEIETGWLAYQEAETQAQVEKAAAKAAAEAKLAALGLTADDLKALGL